MRAVIDDYVRNLGVTIVLDNKHFSDILDIHYYNFIGKDKKFYSLLVVSNDTQILVNFRKCFKYSSDFVCDYYDGEIEKVAAFSIDKFDDLVLALNANLRQFDTKDDWLIGKWKLRDAKTFCSWFKSQLQNYLLDGCNYEEYSLCSHKIWTRPSLGCSFSYKKNGRYCGTINVWHGCKTELCYEKNFYEFINLLGISKYIIWVMETAVDE